MDFDYFYNREAEGFNFLKVPEILVEGEEFQGLSAEAILLYAMLLKRAGMSYKNNWLDKQNRVFIYFTVEEIMRKRHLSKPTAIKLLDELDKKNRTDRKSQSRPWKAQHYLCERLLKHGARKNSSTEVQRFNF